MNIESFNRELAKKVAIANSNEKHGELQKAINVWISITEMTLNASKDPSIDSTYRNMLIKKTEQIVQHIKGLKVKLAIPISKQVNEDVQASLKIQNERDLMTENIISEQEDPEITENIDNSGMPEGFLEIKASNEFQILTPHEKIDKNILKDARKVYKLDDEESDDENRDIDNIVIEPSKDSKKRICFACGSENPPNLKKCKSCNTDLI